MQSECVQSEWSEWSGCNSEGKRTRSRTTTTPALNGGTPCDPLTEEGTCPAVNCVQSEWSEWGECNSEGKKTRSRTTTTPALYGGTLCLPLTEEGTCPAVNCVQSDLSEWGECEYDIDTNTYVKRQRRTTTTPALYGGTPCLPLIEEGTCPAVNCVQSDLSEWGECEYDIDTNTYVKRQRRTTTTPALYGGTPCLPLIEEGTCPAVNCVQSGWTNSGGCNSSTGKQSQIRTTTTAALNGGTVCGDTTQDINCDVNCVQSGWTNSGGCNSSTGKQSQIRTTTIAALNDGTVCGDTTQDISCTPTGFDNERFYIKDGYGNYLGQYTTNKWMGVGSVSAKTYFTLDGSFTNVTIKGGINDKYCAQMICTNDSPENVVYSHVSSMASKGYWTFERQSDGGYRIRPKMNDGGAKSLYSQEGGSYGGSLGVNPDSWLATWGAKTIFYLENP